MSYSSPRGFSKSRDHHRTAQIAGHQSFTRRLSCGALIAVAAVATLHRAASASPCSFTELATFRGIGGVLNALVGPGPEPGSERFYLSYNYVGSTLDIVAVNLENGAYEVYTSPVRNESGAWAMAVGPDGKLYVGTTPNAHLLRLDPTRKTLIDLGQPSTTETYIWQLALGSDRRLYGCTYPSCKLVRYDPATSTNQDLGRLDPHEQYARSIAASDDGFVYVGIGTSQAHLVAYEIRTGHRRDLLPEALRAAGTATVVRGQGGVVYGWAGDQYFRLQGWQAVPIPAEAYRPEAAARMRDGRSLTLEGDTLRVTGRPFGDAVFTLRYPGKEINLFRLGLGPDGMLYGSSVIPIHFLRVHPRTGEWITLGELGSGEYYSFLRHGSTLLGAAYGGEAPLMIYRPERPFHPGPAAEDNPRLIHYPGEDSSWRPEAMIAGPDGKVYLGAIPGYGKLGGPLVVFDPATGATASFPQVVKDQSIQSLAVAEGQSTPGGWALVGATTVAGGNGSIATATEARLFLWDPATRAKLYETVAVPGAREITDLVSSGDGRILGIAGGKMLFAFDPQARRVIQRVALPFTGVIANAIGRGPRGRFYGLSPEGIFSIDPETYAVSLEASYRQRITAGFALERNALYFAAGPRLVRCDLATE